MTEKPARQPLLRELHRLLLWVTLPLVLLISAHVYLEFVQASRAAEGFVQRSAGRVASDVSEFLAATERGLTLMAKRPGVLLMDPLRCDSGLGDLIAIQPRYVNTNVINMQGQVICGAMMPPPGQPAVNVADRDWFQAVLTGKPFALGQVRRGPILGRWVSTAAVPIRGADQAIVGVMVVAIDLVGWPLNALASDQQADAVQGVIDRTGMIVLRSPDAEKWVGRNSGNSQITADMLSVGEGTFVSKGVQGFDRFWAAKPIAGTPWIAYAGVRADAVRAEPLRQAALSTGVILAIVLAASWLTLKASRRLTAPIVQLAQVAARAGEGDLSVRAEPAGPAEVALVAQEVNRMLELRASTEADLRVSELALQAISQGVIITGPDQIITSVNASFTAITGYSAAEILGRNCKFLQGPDTHPETVAAIRAAMRRPAAFAGEILNYRKDGTVFWNELTIAPVFGVHNTLAHFIGITRDVSARRAAELQLRHQESLLAQADTLAGLGRWDWNLAAGGASWSEGLYRIYGRDPADGVPAFDAWQETVHPDDHARLAHCIQTALAGTSAYHVEFRIFTKDTGQLRYVESRGSSVVDANGKPTNIRGFDLDISERKLAENALQAALKEKTALLMEVHHRVKNNLQVVISLLRLETRRSTLPEAVDVLNAMQWRIQAMAQLHQSLYRSGTFASVDLGVYLGQIATQTFQTQLLSNQRVELKLNLGSVSVGMDQAMVCGLLVNELVSNCLKHAFPDDRSGQVYVELQPADQAAVQIDRLWSLRVSDSGLGLPPDFEEKRKSSLGMVLVGDLSQQAGGTLEIRSRPGVGAEFSVVFRALEPEALVMPA